MFLLRLFLVPIAIAASLSAASAWAGDDFQETVRPFLKQHCVACHGGEKVKGEVDFSSFHTMADAEASPELWETAMFLIEDGEMPPEDEAQPSEAERIKILDWFEHTFFGAIESKPAAFKLRRLSGPEYRNTMRSLFGFDLEVNIIEAEQTIAEKSLIAKLLPPDPPGKSGYVNDTHLAPLTTTLWDQYSYLANAALEQHFASHKITNETQARSELETFIERAHRRPASADSLQKSFQQLAGKSGADLTEALKAEMRVAILSPRFLYRGALVKATATTKAQKVDPFELAERLSYFLWEDMQDDALMALALTGELYKPEVYSQQLDRMLKSPKSRSLAASFGSQWLLLNQIGVNKKDPTKSHPLVNQPIEFLHYLFTEDRPVMELIDSDVTFFNATISHYYGNDRKLLKKVNKPRGMERMITPLQKVQLNASLGDRRAGILTMPGVLEMNRGPILRGTWMLRQILGEHLGEPPPNIPPIQSTGGGKKLSFRERFELHRADKSCALCHKKIDPLGFALQGYNNDGGVIGKTQSRKKKTSDEQMKNIDTSGQLPSGEKFANFQELHGLLLTVEREKIIRNAVEQMLAYALCRKLERNDRPTVDKLTAEILHENGTWRDLIFGIAESVPFTETIFVAPPK